MSRHMITKVIRSEVNEDGKEPEVHIHYAYGYDRPLKEYFLDAVGVSMLDVIDGFEHVISDAPYELVGTGSIIYGSGANLLDMAKRLDLKLPDGHAGQAAMDLPITGDGWTTIAKLNGEDE